MDNIQALKNKGFRILEQSGWEKSVILKIKESFVDFLSQAFCDEMYNGVDVELSDDDDIRNLVLFWPNGLKGTRVYIYDNASASWNLHAAIYDENGKETECCSFGEGGGERIEIIDGIEYEPDDQWAFHFYWWLEEMLEYSKG